MLPGERRMEDQHPYQDIDSLLKSKVENGRNDLSQQIKKARLSSINILVLVTKFGEKGTRSRSFEMLIILY